MVGSGTHYPKYLHSPVWTRVELRCVCVCMCVHIYIFANIDLLIWFCPLDLDSSSAYRTQREHWDVAVDIVWLCCLVISFVHDILRSNPASFDGLLQELCSFEMSLSRMPYRVKILLCKNPSTLNDITTSLHLSYPLLFHRQPFANIIQNEYCHFHQDWNLRLCLKSPWHILQAEGEECQGETWTCWNVGSSDDSAAPRSSHFLVA